MAGMLNFGLGQGLLGGQQPVLPRVPWKQNQAVTGFALGMLGAPNIHEGFRQAAPMAVAGMAGNNNMQQLMLAQQEKNDAQARQKAAWNAGMKWKSGVALTQEDQDALAGAPNIAAHFMPASPDLPNSVEEFQYGQANPAYNEWMLNQKKAGATNIDNVGSIPQGYELYTDPATGAKRMQVIPGGPAAISEKSASQVEQAGAESQAVKAETMLDATQSIKNEFKNASMPVTGTLSRPFAKLSSTAAGRVRSYVGSLKSGVALQAILKLKEASATGATGFGALSAPELQLLVDDIGSLDPDNTEPDIFLKSIERIEQRWRNVLQDVQRTVPPERLAEMGIDINALMGVGGGAPSGGGVYDWTPDAGLRPAQ